ncbi:hypothetical protein FOA52_009533 [Chlamydomonas sp. UWO 241]|nr:hypothetical protein FOA52_009533 [Chlamydomonas sp. UWO 241]
MARVLLKRGAESLVGVHVGSGGVAVTASGDGVSLLDGTTLNGLRSFPLGGSSASFEGGGAVLLEGSGLLCCLLRDGHSGSEAALVAVPSAGPAEHTLADAAPRVPLPTGSRPHSLHALRAGAGSECVAVVLVSGQVAWTCPAGGELSMHTAAAAAAPKKGSSAVAAKPRAASSCCDALGVLSQPSAGSDATVQMYAWRGGSLSPSHALPAACPSPTAIATQLHLAGPYALVEWSSGAVSIVQGAGVAGGSGQVDVSGSELLGGGGSDAAPTSSSAPSAAALAGKKRKPAAANAAAGAGPVMATPYDDTQFMVARLSVGRPSPGLHYALVDASFGCAVSTGHITLEPAVLAAAGAAATSASAPPRLFAAGGGDGPRGTVLLSAGGALLALPLSAPRASLLGLVGRLAIGAGAAGSSTSAAPAPRGTLHVAELMPAAASSGLPGSSSAAGKAAPGGSGHGSAAGTAAGVLFAAPAAAVSVSPGPQGEADLVARLNSAVAGSDGDGSNTSSSCAKLLPSALSACEDAARGSRGVSPSLASATARCAGAAGAWEDLARLLSLLPMQGLPGSCCSYLLSGASCAQRYELLCPLACKLDEAVPSELVAALSTLLSPTTPANQASRKGYHTSLRAHAKAAISDASPQLRMGSASGAGDVLRGEAWRHALNLAHCAAAAVDGFGYSEVTLHALLSAPLDAPALHGCLARLSNRGVDRLLTYLAKWVDKYTHVLGDGAASVPLPSELLIPTFAQVLEWLRVLLDAHLARLLMARQPHPALPALAGALRDQMGACQQLLPLLGTAEHIRHAAPLPHPHVAAATQYTVELLDLGTRMAA